MLAASTELFAAPSEWHDQTLVLELEALLDARKALMQELQVLDAQVASHFSRLLPQTQVGACPPPLPQRLHGGVAKGHSGALTPIVETTGA